jgi:hypothetical protein
MGSNVPVTVVIPLPLSHLADVGAERQPDAPRRIGRAAEAEHAAAKEQVRARAEGDRPAAGREAAELVVGQPHAVAARELRPDQLSLLKMSIGLREIGDFPEPAVPSRSW